MRRLLLVLPLLALAGCMRVPPGTHMVVTDNPTPLCGHYENCYLTDSATIVLVSGQPLKVAAHEACHAHQDEEVREELGIRPSIDLHEWYQTHEAAAYEAAVAGHPHPYWAALVNEDTLLERFAEACGRYLARDPRYPSDPVDDAFFEEEGF